MTDNSVSQWHIVAAIAVEKSKFNFHGHNVAHKTWRRAVHAAAAMDKEESERTFEYLHQSGKLSVLSAVLGDICGRSYFFWETAAQQQAEKERIEKAA